jgi:hypothetical protein
MKIDELNEILDSTELYLANLTKEENFKYYPAREGLTTYGKNLELGFSTFAIKILKMINKIEEYEIDLWVDYINSFQSLEYENIQNNFFVDPQLADSYNNVTSSTGLKDSAKKVINLFSNKYDTNEIKFRKAVNAETKQAVSTLFEIGHSNEKVIQIDKSENQILKDLKDLNWETPWSAGGQFSTYCVYTASQNWGIESLLKKFISELVSSETGSYYTNLPKTSREVINGAMKVISGLDWIEQEIHYPKQLIDFCLKNKPILEGCDIVDYVYVLYKCSQQVNYKKQEINGVLNETLHDLIQLYKQDEKGFSYFKGKSQTYYYGVEITKGNDCADIQSTTLCVWAIVMILQNNESLESRYNLIKP